MSSLKEKSLESGGAAKKIRITLTSTDVKALEKGELRARGLIWVWAHAGEPRWHASLLSAADARAAASIGVASGRAPWGGRTKSAVRACSPRAPPLLSLPLFSLRRSQGHRGREEADAQLPRPGPHADEDAEDLHA